MRSKIKALFKRYKDQPDQEAEAVDLILPQTELMSEDWVRRDLGKCSGRICLIVASIDLASLAQLCMSALSSAGDGSRWAAYLRLIRALR
jgi:hypothetical protein